VTVRCDVAIVGAGPAGLSAALQLVRARRSVLLVDSNRPRNAATFSSHGFLSRDGISPLELRKIGADEVAGYPGATIVKAVVTSVSPDADGGFVVRAEAPGTGVETEAIARAVLLATGLIETFPSLPSLRAFYGTSLHSCVECDGWEHRDAPLALIGESGDLAERARFLSNWSDDLIVFTNGVGVVSAADEAELAARGIRVERRAISDVEGGREGLTGVVLDDGEVVPRSAGFVRPAWTAAIAFAETLGLVTDAEGLVSVDECGRTNLAGVYAAGDITPPGPQQLIVAAGAGATAANQILRDLLG
jgi:thioredoxin reductase